MKSDNKIIIGSGLAGPLLAIYLGLRDYNVKLYEKRLDLRKNNISAGRSINLALSHRGIKALKAAKVFEQIEPLLIPMKGRMIHLLKGELDYQPYSSKTNDCINSVSRSALNNILMTKAESFDQIEILFNHTLLKIDGNKHKLVFTNGKKIPLTKHIFGADGLNSNLRKYIDKNSLDKSYIEPLGHVYKELNIPPDKKGDFQLDPNALHIWPRENFMLIALPNTNKSFTCTLFISQKGRNSIESLSSPNLVLDFFEKYFKDILPLLENFPEVFFSNPTGDLGTVYTENWHYNNQYCLIGDSAHAIVPFFGQGMNASFEDCEIFINCLDQNHNQWDNIFNKYESLHKVDGFAIAKMALENYIEMRDLVIKKDFIKNKQLANILWEKFPNKFIPRYNMVSFTSIPYSEVYKRGKIQDRIIKQLNLDNPNMELAEKLINEKLTPII